MNAFTIKDLENLSGIKAHTIRIWEQRYAFLKPERTDTNIRFYNNNELKVLLNVALLNKFGYKVSRINEMSSDEMTDKIISLAHYEAQQERIINELIKNMIDVDMDQFEFVLNNFISAKGIDKAINQILFPFLQKIGMLWRSNHINPGQEHLVTNIIRQKIVVGIETIRSHIAVDKTALLFLPENEFHELGLLYVHYILKSRGVKVLYLGCNVPLSDLIYIIKLKKPDYLHTHLITNPPKFNLERFITNLNAQAANIPFLFSGSLITDYKKELPANIIVKRSLQEVHQHIATL